MKTEIHSTKRLSGILGALFVILFAAAGTFLIFNSKAAVPVTYYVSKTGSNGDGKSWSTAWNELSKINWSVIQPGDTILIDGGQSACASNYDFTNHSSNRPGLNCGMLYTTQLNIQKNGASGLPINIKLATEAGRNGTAVIFGGRTTALPYCTQNYTGAGTARADGIVFNTRANGASYINIDGVKRSGIMVYGAEAGVDLISDNTSNVTLRNMEIFDNGTYSTFSAGGYNSDNPGIFLAGSNITLDQLLIHDNGQDEIQDTYTGTNGSHAAMSNITLSSSWLYNNRDHPSWTGYPFNSGAEGTSQDCTHVDGVQVWGGGTRQDTFKVKDSVFGPLLAQGFYPGDENNASFDNVSITNTLFINSLLHNIEGDPINTPTNNTPLNWQISNITSYLTDGVNTGTVSHGFGVWGQGHGIKNSIFYNGYFANSASFTGSNSGNIYYKGDAVPAGTSTNPNFVGPLPTNNSPKYANLVNADFTPTCAGCSGKGSNIHKVQDLLNAIDTNNAISTQTDQTANLWVDPNGGSCTRSANPNAYNDSTACTIDQAYQASSPGDLVLVKGGTYGDMVINDVPAKDGAAWNGTTGIKPVTIRAASGETVSANDLTTHASNLILDGINTTISDASGVGEPTILGPLHDVTLQNLKGRAFYITGAAYNVTIKNVEIGPRIAGSGSQIKTATNGGDDPDPAQQPHDILIDGLYIHDYTTDNPGTGHMDCLHVFYHYNLTIKNSKFLRCGLPNAGYGVLLGSNGSGHTEHDLFENNVFDGSIAGFALRGGAGEDFNDVQVRYNSGSLITTQTTNTLNNVNWIANAASDIGPCRANSYSYNVSTATSCGGTDLKANPGFKNSTAGDFTLLSTSPAIGHGNPTDYPQKDLLGITRPQGSGADAGAYEYQSGGGGACSTKQGDANNDNLVNILDISAILSAYGQSSSSSCADVNKDGSVNIQDLSLVLSKYGT